MQKQTTHVDAFTVLPKDPGSIPGTSTKFFQKPLEKFGGCCGYNNLERPQRHYFCPPAKRTNMLYLKSYSFTQACIKNEAEN